METWLQQNWWWLVGLVGGAAWLAVHLHRPRRGKEAPRLTTRDAQHGLLISCAIALIPLALAIEAAVGGEWRVAGIFLGATVLFLIGASREFIIAKRAVRELRGQ